jgi:hypothetical protein
MQNAIYLDSNLKPTWYAWPGGYPVFYLSRNGFRDGETMELDYNEHDRSENVTCAKCAGNAAEEALILIASDVNYEDASLYCDVCSERIESAYTIDQDEDEDDTDDTENEAQ